MYGYYLIDAEISPLWAREQRGRVWVYVEPQRDSYMGVPLFCVWHKDVLIAVCCEATLHTNNAMRARYEHARHLDAC